MGITINLRTARQRLEAAVELAREGGQELPDEWLQATEEIGRSPSRTYVAMLGTALLAKATDPRIEPLAHKEGAGDRGYSARGICHLILVPAAAELGFHLGATGREPLNNQPFFRYDRVDQIEKVQAGARPFLDRLIEHLRRLDEFTADQALLGLAAFFRARTDYAAALQKLDLAAVKVGVKGLIEAVEGFLRGGSEFGRTGQAFIAAVFDLVFDNVRTHRVHDPSRHAPGDVQVIHDGRIVIAAEVRQKPMPEHEVLDLAKRLGAAGIRRGVVAALAPDQPALSTAAIRDVAWERHQVLMTIFHGPAEALLGALAWSENPLEASLAEFPAKMLERLEELEASEASQQVWAGLVATGSADLTAAIASPRVPGSTPKQLSFDEPQGPLADG